MLTIVSRILADHQTICSHYHLAKLAQEFLNELVIFAQVRSLAINLYHNLVAD
ncbi:hypothetical protein Plhal304r1_c084g0168201 [Plasmopara halstedii]